jgi:hypothetical protein
MSFTPQIKDHAGDAGSVREALRDVLDELGVQAREDPNGNFWADYTPGSYEPIRLKIFFPEETGVISLEGLAATIEGQPIEDLRRAINYLNAEAQLYRFYVSEGDGPMESELLVRHDLLPNLDEQPVAHTREVRQILTGLCAQKAIFADTLKQIQAGRSWRMIKDALRAMR